MQPRPFWEERIEASWRRRSVLWLMGVRRVGKTSLARGLPDVEYLDCELPRVRRDLEDPEAFLASVRGRRVVLDEVHRLPNPSELLKIAADHHRDVKLLATGSSTLGASDAGYGPLGSTGLPRGPRSAWADLGAWDLGRHLCVVEARI